VRGLQQVAGPIAVLAAAFFAGSVPFSQIAACRFSGEDLRQVGTGTVSGTALYRVAGFGPLVKAGILDVAKGAFGPLLGWVVLRRSACTAPEGRGRCVLAPRTRRKRADKNEETLDSSPHGTDYVRALAVGAAIVGHNWSPWLGGKGGRGLSPALGSTVVLAPEGAVVLAAGMAIGRLARQSALVTGMAAASLPAVLAARRGAPGTVLGLCICLPMLIKRVLGNSPLCVPDALTGGARLGARARERLLFDRDPSREVHRA
jgi:glycerol-3-phosphate acyltransferase PlsY